MILQIFLLQFPSLLHRQDTLELLTIGIGVGDVFKEGGAVLKKLTFFKFDVFVGGVFGDIVEFGEFKVDLESDGQHNDKADFKYFHIFLYVLGTKIIVMIIKD